MANMLLSLAMGSSAGLDAKLKEAGQILVTTDTKKIYVDTSSTNRIEMNAAVADKVANSLALQVSGAAFKTFDGSAAQTVNFVAGTGMSVTKSGNNITYACTLTIPTALKNPTALSWGSKTYDGSQARTIELADFGLTNVMHFLGTTTTAIADGNTTATVKIGETNVQAVSGDVVLNGGKEYVWTGSAWEILGDEGSWALKSVKIEAGNLLTVAAGGTLAENTTIAHAAVTTTPPTSGVYIKSIATDGYGHVTGWTSGDCYNLICQIAGTTKVTYDPFADTQNKTFNIPVMTGASSSAAGAVGLVPAPAAGATTRFLGADGSWQSLVQGTGITVSGATITNAGVRSVTKKSNNVLTVNTNGTTADITVVNAATASASGVVKVGDNITVTSGTISITADNVRNAVGAATASNSGYLQSTDFVKLTDAYGAVTWGSF